MAKNQDPLISAWFSVDFGGTIKGAFRECTGMGSENEIVEYKGTKNGVPFISKTPGRIKWNNIVLKRGITDSMDMWQWRQMVEKGQVEQARKNGSITMHSGDGSPMARWDFLNAWPSKLTGPAANAGNNEIGIEE